MFFQTEHEVDTDQDIISDEFWARTYRQKDETFGWLRKNAPVSWHLAMDSHGYPNSEAGFWAVTRAADIRYVSENHEIFSSGISKSISVRPMPPFPPSMLISDPPEHEQYRHIMSAGFTPKAVNRLIEKITTRAEGIVDRVVGAGEFDFVKEVSSRLPMLTIADLFGVPDELIEEFTQAGDNWAGAGDPEIRPEGMDAATFAYTQMGILHHIGVEVVNLRRKHPADDLATALGQALIDGRPLTDDEIGATTLLLSVAGNDTTKQTTSWAVNQLWNDPAQKAWLADDFDGRIAGSIEEFVRHASPVAMFSRTATQDTELAGKQISKYDKVVMWYLSGNRDEEVFDDPWKFDLTRGRTPHLGFGGGGIHYCLGNAVAKAQLRALFKEFLHKLPNMEVGEPDYLFSELFNGIRKLPVRVG